MPDCRTRLPLIAATLLMTAFGAVSAAAATGADATEPVPEVAPTAAPEPASGITTDPDPCLSAVQEGATEAERHCSDQIAGLRYDGASGRTALPGALNNRAIARMQTGDLEGAAADLTEALELAPDASALYLNRARLALMSGDASAALDDLAQAQALMPPGSAAAMAADRSAVLAWRMLGNLGAAEALLAESLAQERASTGGPGKALN